MLYLYNYCRRFDKGNKHCQQLKKNKEFHLNSGPTIDCIPKNFASKLLYVRVFCYTYFSLFRFIKKSSQAGYAPGHLYPQNQSQKNILFLGFFSRCLFLLVIDISISRQASCLLHLCLFIYEFAYLYYIHNNQYPEIKIQKRPEINWVLTLKSYMYFPSVLPFHLQEKAKNQHR